SMVRMGMTDAIRKFCNQLPGILQVLSEMQTRILAAWDIGCCSRSARCRSRAGDREGHRATVVALRIDFAAAQRAAFDDRAIGYFLDADSQRAQTDRHYRDAV